MRMFKLYIVFSTCIICQILHGIDNMVISNIDIMEYEEKELDKITIGMEMPEEQQLYSLLIRKFPKNPLYYYRYSLSKIALANNIVEKKEIGKKIDAKEFYQIVNAIEEHISKLSLIGGNYYDSYLKSLLYEIIARYEKNSVKMQDALKAIEEYNSHTTNKNYERFLYLNYYLKNYKTCHYVLTTNRYMNYRNIKLIFTSMMLGSWKEALEIFQELSENEKEYWSFTYGYLYYKNNDIPNAYIIANKYKNNKLLSFLEIQFNHQQHANDLIRDEAASVIEKYGEIKNEDIIIYFIKALSFCKAGNYINANIEFTKIYQYEKTSLSAGYYIEDKILIDNEQILQAAMKKSSELKHTIERRKTESINLFRQSILY